MYRIFTKWLACGFLFLFISCTASEPKPKDDQEKPGENEPPTVTFEETAQLKKIKGNSIQIDPNMLYEQGISPATLIVDLKMANIKSVHFFVAGYWDGLRNDQLLKPDYLQALKREGIAIWIMLLGNCIYGSSGLPEDWQMEFLSPYPDQSIEFYSFHRPEFVEWQVKRVKNVLLHYDVDGIEFAESYFPEWKTINGNGFYGDVSAYARKKFTEKYVGASRSTLSFDYIRKDPTLYPKWMDFRADAILDFNRKIKAAIQETKPNVLYAAWGMGVRKGTMAEIREHFGLDMIQMVKEIQPDVLVLQTSAQDWLDPHLLPDYTKEYAPLAKAIQAANPKVALSIQTDIVSLGYSNPNVEKRHPEWWLRFFDHSLQSGYYTNTAYEYAFSKKEGIWIERNLPDQIPRKLFKEASLQAAVLADAEIPLAVVKEQDNHWKMVYTAKGLGWFYLD
ncbi:family 10 glycosylhydrolase [Olivibacter sp. SA151]|uniref:family 10 glycosylhydrolase n=1 Tax=Olivibacter jilunii TaxID=985016 RepID=UPI003F13D8D7